MCRPDREFKGLFYFGRRRPRVAQIDHVQKYQLQINHIQIDGLQIDQLYSNLPFCDAGRDLYVSDPT